VPFRAADDEGDMKSSSTTRRWALPTQLRQKERTAPCCMPPLDWRILPIHSLLSISKRADGCLSTGWTTFPACKFGHATKSRRWNLADRRLRPASPVTAPPETTSPTSLSAGATSGGMHGGALAGVIIAAAIVVLSLVLWALFAWTSFCRGRRREKSTAQPDGSGEKPAPARRVTSSVSFCRLARRARRARY